jgi:hypothetical protein
MEMLPDVPELAVPELNTNTPLVPILPAFAVLTVTAPLVDDRPWPVIMPIAPPVFTVFSPAVAVINPPAPLSPLPTEILIDPPLPNVAAPEPIEIEPLLPTLEVPELKTNTPLVPEAPAFAVLIVMTPLLVGMPSPLTIPTAPPERIVLCPA